MKRISIFLATAAIAALATLSCNKNELNVPEEPVGPKVSVRISGAPEDAREVDPSTRTFIDENNGSYTAKWSNEGEALGLVLGTVDANTKPVTLEAEPTTDNDPVFAGELTAEDGTYNIFVFYPASAFGTAYGDGGLGFDLKDVQNPVLGSFDPAADLMGYSSDDAVVEGGSLVLENIGLQRPMAILRINLNADSDAKAFGQKVSSLKMQVPSDLILTGRAKISAAGMEWNQSLKRNHVKAEIDLGEEITVGESDGFNAVYLVVNPLLIPAGTEINFIVETEDYNGTTAFNRTVTAPSDMQFQAGNVNVIGLKLRDKDLPTVSDKSYVKVASNGDLEDGHYLIVYEDGSLAFDGGLGTLDAASNTINVVIEDDAIPSTSVTDAAAFTIEAMEEGYSILSASGKYIGQTSDANGMKVQDEPLANSISISEGNADIVSGGAYLRYNATSGQERFRYYKSASYMNQKAIALYRLEEEVDPTPRITFEGDENGRVEKTVPASTTTVEFPYTKNKYVTELPTLTKVGGLGLFDGEPVVSDNKVTINIIPNTDETDKRIIVKMTGQGIADEGVVLTIVQEAYVPAPALTIKSLNDQIREDNITAKASAKEYSGKIENVIITGARGGYVFAEDETGGILFYQVSDIPAVGKIMTGETAVSAYMYNGMPEAISLNLTNITVGDAPALPSATFTSIADLQSVWNERMSMRTVLKNMTVTSAFNNRNATVEDAQGNSITVRDYANAGLTLSAGDVVSITGYPAQYNANQQFAVLTPEDIAIFTDPDTPTLIVTPSSLSWGTSETEVKTISVTTNENATGYTVSPTSSAEWNISDNGQGTISVSPKAANASTTADKTLSLVISHKDEPSVTETVECVQAKNASITIADILAAGAKTFTGTTGDILVYAVNGKNAIIGDSSAKMFLFWNNHGCLVGDIVKITDPVTSEYNGILELTGGTIAPVSSGNTVDHGTPVNLNDASAASSTYTTFSAAGFHSAAYVSMTGTQSERNITGSYPNTTLYLNVADASHDGQSVSVKGYIYSWSSSHSNYNFQAVSIEEDTTTPLLSVSPASLNWGAAETGAKTITVTLNASASATDYSYTATSGSAGDWNISKDGFVITVSPKAANTSTTADKVLTLKIAHSSDATVYKEVTLTQSKAGGSGAPQTVEIVILDYATNNNWDSAGTTSYSITSEDVTLTPSDNGAGSLNGVYWGGNDWRFYQARGGGLTVSVPQGKQLVEATFTYTVTKNGTLLDPDGSQLPSGTKCSLSGQSAFFTIGNTNNGTAGQVRFTKIVVVYK